MPRPDGKSPRPLPGGCRPESASVGVGWGQDWGQSSRLNWQLPVHGNVASDHDGPHGIPGCVRPVGAYHVLLAGLGVASEEYAGRTVDQEDGYRALTLVSQKSSPGGDAIASLRALPSVLSCSSSPSVSDGYEGKATPESRCRRRTHSLSRCLGLLQGCPSGAAQPCALGSPLARLIAGKIARAACSPRATTGRSWR